MAMLLGAARHLCDTRDFRGAVAVIFQPAEEGGAGGEAMVADGLMEKFDIARVYGMHNFPGIPVGQFATRKGGITASADVFRIVITGRGGHAAMPHAAVDPVHIASHVVIALQSIASRSVDPLESVVVSVTQFHAGEASNVIPQRAELTGTVRTLKPEVRSQARELLHRVTAGVTQALGGTAEINYDFEIGYPSTANHAAETDMAVRAARSVSGDERVDENTPPVMAAEDFAFMLRARPGNFMLIGNGDTAFCHHPAYDFNDAAIPYGVSYWVELAKLELGGQAKA
jgi:hippurate hydrolase